MGTNLTKANNCVMRKSCLMPAYNYKLIYKYHIHGIISILYIFSIYFFIRTRIFEWWLNVFFSYSHIHNNLPLQFTKTWKKFTTNSAKKRNRFLIFWREKSTIFSNIWSNYNRKFIGAFEKHLCYLLGLFPKTFCTPIHFIQPRHFF